MKASINRIHLNIHKVVSSKYAAIQSRVETFVKKMLSYFGTSLKSVNFEFSPLSDEHFDCIGSLPATLEEINLNGCREISERTVMLIAKSCPALRRIGKITIANIVGRALLEL